MGTPYCWIHRKSTEHLIIKDSTIPHAGKGLFACNPSIPDNDIIFRNGDIICEYDGDIITEHILNMRYHSYTAPYGTSLNNHMYEDGALHRGIGNFANHSTQPNARLSIKRNNTAQLVATKNIRNNHEILINYGRSYRLNEAGVETTTNKKKYNI